MKRQIFIAFVFLAFFLAQTAAQDESELNRLDEKLSQHLETKMAGWKHKRGEPMEGSKGVLIEFWSFSNRIVKISIVPYKSAQEAREIVQGFTKYESQKEELKGCGDEAYAWGYGLSRIVFRRAKFVVYVSTDADVESDPDAQTLSQSEKGERERSEMKRLSKEFAKHVASAIDLP